MAFGLSFAIVPVPLTALLLCIFQNLHWITSSINLNFAIWQFKIPLFYSYGLVALISLVPALYLFLKILQEQEVWTLKLTDLQSVLRQVEKERDNFKAQLMQVLEMTAKVPYSVSFDKCIRHQVMGEPVRWIDLPQNVFPAAVSSSGSAAVNNSSSSQIKTPAISVSQLPKAPLASPAPTIASLSAGKAHSSSVPFTTMLSNLTDAITDAIFALSAYIYYDLLKVKPRPVVLVNSNNKGKAKITALAETVAQTTTAIPDAPIIKRRGSSKSARTSPVDQPQSGSRGPSPGHEAQEHNISSGDDSSESRYPSRRRRA